MGRLYIRTISTTVVHLELSTTKKKHRDENENSRFTSYITGSLKASLTKWSL